MDTESRLSAYKQQNGTQSLERLSARQTRRINKKARREFKDYRQRWVTSDGRWVELNEP